MKNANLLVVGVGGQGTLLASTVLAAVGVRAGFDVKKAEVHGMAQRGGAVQAHLRLGIQFAPGGIQVNLAEPRPIRIAEDVACQPGGL